MTAPQSQPNTRPNDLPNTQPRPSTSAVGTRGVVRGFARLRGTRPRGASAIAAVSVLLAIGVLIVCGPLLAGDTVNPVSFPYDRQAGVFGADAVGRSVGNRVAAGGARLLVALPIGIATTVIITVLSLIAVQRRSWRALSNRFSATLLAIPSAVVVLAAASIFPAWVAVAAAMLLLGVPQGVRQLSAAAAPLMTAGFVESARMRGESTLHIAVREMLPALIPLIIADAAVRCLAAMQLMVGVHILGLGPTAPTPDWALMIRENLPGVMLNPAAVIAPTAAIAGLLLGVVVVFDILVNLAQPPHPRNPSAITPGAGRKAPAEAAGTKESFAPPAQAMIDVGDVVITLPHTAPIHLEPFTVDRGGILGITGPSGSGKTTLLSLLAACPTPGAHIEGDVWLGGQRYPTGAHSGTRGRWWRRWRRTHIGLVEQDAATTVDTARTQWSIIRDGRPRRQIDEDTVRRTAVALQLQPETFGTLARISGGQATRLALVRALAHRPDILILDEPTTGLDADAIEAVKAVITRAADDGAAVIVCSHDIDFLKDICDDALIVNVASDRATITATTLAALPESHISSTTSDDQSAQPSAQVPAQAHPHHDAARPDARTSIHSSDAGDLTVKGLDVRSPRGALLLHGVDFTLTPGSFGVITGPSGCGKTTLIRSILGLAGPGPLREHCAYAAQDAAQALHPMFTLNHQIRRAATCGGHPAPAQRAAELINAVGLTGVADHTPGRCSGGQRQRANIARALAADRRILVVDEPTTGLDEQHARGIIDLLRKLCAQGTTVLAITHDPAVIRSADTIIDVTAWTP